jgi:hypothetical protein
MTYTINGTTKIISPAEAPVDGAISIDVQEIYSRWVDWLFIGDNSKYYQAMRAVGGDPLPGSKSLGLTYFLLNGWKIKPYEADHVFTLNGNLYSEDGSSPFVSTTGSFNVTIISSVSNLVDSTVQQLPEIEYASFNSRITLDVENGVAGTTYPIGTPTNPVNNLSDAKTIATARGFRTIAILSSLTISTGESVAECEIISENWLVVTVETGADTTNTEFTKISLYGELSGTWNVLNDCWAYNVTNFLGWMRGGSLESIELAPYSDIDPFTLGSSYFDNIVPMYADTPTSLTMNTNTSVTITHSSEIHTIKNMGAGSAITIGMIHGKVIIDSSCTGGDIQVMGIGTYINNSLLTVDDSMLVNPESIQEGLLTEDNFLALK